MEIWLMLLRVTGMFAVTVVSLLLVACHVTYASYEWKLLSSSCIATSAAPSPAQQQQVRSEIECAFIANRLSGHLVAEFNPKTLQCTVYFYQSVCRLIDAAASPNENNRCIVLGLLPVRDAAALLKMQKLRAAWVFGGSAAESENLICGESRQWQPQAIDLTEEGAEFNGANSLMTLSNADFGNFGLGFTWLLRLRRRKIQDNALLDNLKCGTTAYGVHFWMTNGVNNLYMQPMNAFGKQERFYTTNSPITTDTNRFINIGVSAEPQASNYRFFNEGSFIDQSSVIKLPNSASTQLPHHCFILGAAADGDPRRFNGTVRAVAIANASMTEAEIKSFFDLLV